MCTTFELSRTFVIMNGRRPGLRTMVITTATTIIGVLFLLVVSERATGVRASGTPVVVGIPAYEVHWFDQTVDHFNLQTQPATFRQRYLTNDAYWSVL